MGGTSLVMGLENRKTNRSACLEQFSSSIHKVSVKINSMSLGVEVLEEKSFTRAHTQTPQSDAIRSADSQVS